jgi:hypothetical protein
MSSKTDSEICLQYLYPLVITVVENVSDTHHAFKILVPRGTVTYKKSGQHPAIFFDDNFARAHGITKTTKLYVGKDVIYVIPRHLEKNHKKFLRFAKKFGDACGLSYGDLFDREARYREDFRIIDESGFGTAGESILRERVDSVTRKQYYKWHFEVLWRNDIAPDVEVLIGVVDTYNGFSLLDEGSGLVNKCA